MIVKHRSSISSGGGGGSTLIMFVQQTIGLIIIIICSLVLSGRQHVESSSLSPQSTSGNGGASKSGSNNQASKSIQQQQQQASTTAALLSGSSGYAAADNNVAQIKSSLAAAATKHLEPSAAEVSLTSGEARSSTAYSSFSSPTATSSASNGFESSDHDESVPLATINNHSRNNQPQARPPQYVDVSNLMARNANGSSPLAAAGSSSSSSAAAASTLASGLQAKSRSGLPECATQQVCNAIFVRMNYTQRLCECSSNYNWRCSNNLDPQDGHTIELTRKFDKRIYTQIKTCEPLREVRACKSPTDWTLLALQSERSGKAHYVVVCKCPTWAQLEGPYTHNHPPYANIPGIRVYGMLCAHQTARSSAQTYATYNPALNIYPEFPWSEALNVLNTTNLLSTLDSAAH